MSGAILTYKRGRSQWTRDLDGAAYAKLVRERDESRAILDRIDRYWWAKDFHQLSSSQVDALLIEADRQRYRKPRAANGSRARYFWALLIRRALR